MFGSAETAPEQRAGKELVEIAAPDPIAAIRIHQPGGIRHQLLERYVGSKREQTGGAGQFGEVHLRL